MSGELLRSQETLIPPHWQSSNYSEDDIRSVLEQHSGALALAVEFRAEHGLRFAMSERLGQLHRTHGHMPVVAIFLRDIQAARFADDLRGWLVIWLEDGMWSEAQEISRRVPVLAFGKEAFDACTMLIPDPAFIGSRGYLDEQKEVEDLFGNIPWRDRQPTLFWRGASSGYGLETDSWQSVPRIRLCCLAKEMADAEVIDAALSKIIPLSTPAYEKRIRDLGIVQSEVPFTTFLKYRYQIDIDGFTCAWKSCFLKLLSGSVLFKVKGPHVQWYYPRLKAWQHYIPVAADLSDLGTQIAWAKEHDGECEKIARAARDLALSIRYDECVYQYSECIAGLLSRQVAKL